MQIDFELLLVIVNGGLLVLALGIGFYLLSLGLQYPLHLGDSEKLKPMARRIYISMILLILVGLLAAVFNLFAELL